MAYARYFKRNGKTFGPYYYESYRDKNGKIKKKYVGTEDPGKKNKLKVTEEPKMISSSADYYPKTEKMEFKQTSNTITPTNSNFSTLIILLAILILIDISFIFFYFG